MNYEEWFKSLNENGYTTYFLGQEGKVSKEAWDYQQVKIDNLQKQAITQGQNFNDLAQKLKDVEYFNQKLQGQIDELLKALEYVQKSCHKSLSYEHDLFDKGWNHSSRQVIINIYRLTGVGENLINE